MTSVRNFRVEEESMATDLGRGRFVFSDRYSVFDWSGMPGHVPDKGTSLCLIGAYNFELFDANRVPIHYLGVVEDSRMKEFGECESPPTEMTIELAQVPDLPHVDGAHNYDAHHGAAGDDYLIPPEIVFRNTVPMGLSLRQHDEPANYNLGLDEWPDEAVSLPEPVVEFSTKYEGQDRYLSRAGADSIIGKVDLNHLEELALTVNHMLTEHVDEAGFDYGDGKIEYLYHDGTVKVGNVVNTFDKNRFFYGDQQVSKGVVRQYYEHAQPKWVEAVKDARAEAIETGEPNWRKHRVVEPDRLPTDIIETLSDFYCTSTNAYVDYDWLDAPAVEDAVVRIRDLQPGGSSNSAFRLSPPHATSSPTRNRQPRRGSQTTSSAKTTATPVTTPDSTPGGGGMSPSSCAVRKTVATSYSA